ncbi:MAG: fibronectin type III domain-containing protein [Cyclobacteriaceae bacterium]|nr:fibronectin type III domain-containing protein [Cyclobacteriaceae bacterium]
MFNLTQKKMKHVKMLVWLAVFALVAACKEDDEPGVDLATPTINPVTNVTTTSFTANWNAVTGADAYLLDVASDAEFTTYLDGYNKRIVASTEATVEGLVPGSTFYVRVFAQQGDVISSASETQQVSLESTLEAPELAEATDISATGFTATWSAVEGADGYLLEIATDADFTDIVAGYDKLEVSETTYAVTNLTAGQTYFFRVYAKGGEEISPASQTREVSLVE